MGLTLNRRSFLHFPSGPSPRLPSRILSAVFRTSFGPKTETPSHDATGSSKGDSPSGSGYRGSGSGGAFYNPLPAVGPAHLRQRGDRPLHSGLEERAAGRSSGRARFLAPADLAGSEPADPDVSRETFGGAPLGSDPGRRPPGVRVGVRYRQRSRGAPTPETGAPAS